MRILHLCLITLLASCSLIPNSRNLTSVDSSRSIASVNHSKSKFKQIKSSVEVQIKQSIINVCNREFVQISAITGNPNFGINYKQHKLNALSFPISLPEDIYAHSIEKVSNNQYLRINFHKNSKNLSIDKPIFPDIPISRGQFNDQDCRRLQTFADNYHTMNKNISLEKSDLFSFRLENSTLKLSSRNNVSWKQSLKLKDQISKNKNQKIFIKKIQASVSQYNYLIIYQDQYSDEADTLKNFRDEQGLSTLTTSLSELPGYYANQPTPVECQGAFLNECYHYWNDPISGVSQKMLPTLKGFHQETKSFEEYERVSFIPGLIRAHIRQIARTNDIQGVLLIGNDQNIPGIYVDIDHYYWGDYHQFSNQRAKIHTDLMYMLPWEPLTLTDIAHHKQISPTLVVCEKNGISETDMFCDDDQTRNEGNPPLAFLKWAPFVPLSRVFEKPDIKYGFEHYEMEQIIPVGRLPTQEHEEGRKDPVVKDYVAKVIRWENELPEIEGNSILSTGGSPSDEWIFLQDDYGQFYSTYGADSHGYASSFFVPLDKCINCSYKSGADILAEFATKNHVSWVINGHGGHGGLQAPFASAEESDGFSNEDYWVISGSNNQLSRRVHPERNTPKVLENASTLIGHVMANSCDSSNFNLDNELDNRIHMLYPRANQRSFAEQLLTLKNAGALNTYLNSDVGWGGTDNRYSKKFMSHIGNTHNNCGNIGDALRSTIYDMTHGNRGGATEFQAFNRQFLGSPVNSIAKLPTRCKITPRPNGKRRK